MATVICGDCITRMAAMEAESVDAIVADPPYNIGKAAWDKVGGYLEWSETWIAEASRVLKRNGAFWCFHSKPLVLADLSRIIERHGRGLVNWITWDKYAPEIAHSQLYAVRDNGGNRSFANLAEYVVWHADEGDWTTQSDEWLGFIFEELRAYLVSERDRAGHTNQSVVDALGCTTPPQHYFSRSQWFLPTQVHYLAMRDLFNGSGGDYLSRDYEDLRREYEDLRREYLHLRYAFNNPGKVSSVWRFPPAKPNGHPTPKPVDLMRRIVTASTNPGDLVLDPFCGSGSTGVACALEGREFIGIDTDAGYVDSARRRIEQATAQQELAVTASSASTGPRISASVASSRALLSTWSNDHRGGVK